jgi:hypothetical protein
MYFDNDPYMYTTQGCVHSFYIYIYINRIRIDIFYRPVFFLVLRVIFPKSLTSGQLHYSDVMILFDLYIIFELFLKL